MKAKWLIELGLFTDTEADLIKAIKHCRQFLDKNKL